MLKIKYDKIKKIPICFFINKLFLKYFWPENVSLIK